MFTFALLPAVLLAPVPKDFDAKMKWKLAKGDVFYVTSTDSSSGNVTVKIAGGPAIPPQNTESATTTVCKYEVLSADAKSRVVKVTYLECSIGAGTNGQALNSTDVDVRDAAVTLTLDEQFEVTKVEGFKAFAEKLGGKMASAVFGGGATSEAGTAEGLRQVFAVVPPKGINGGAKWQAKASLPMGDMGTLKRTAQCTAADLKDATGHVVINTLAEYEWQVPDEKPDPKADRPTVVSADLKANKCKGTVTFDGKSGRLVGSTEELPFKGTMSMKAGNMTIDLTLDVKVNRTITVTDTPPKDK